MDGATNWLIPMTDTNPPRRRSLRKRLMWAFTLLTTFAVIAQAVALFAANEEQEEDLIDEVVNTALDGVTTQHTNQPEQALARHLSLYHAPIGTPPAGMPAPLLKLPAGNHEWVTGDTEYHVGIRDHDGERFYLLYDATEHEERLAYLLWALVIGAVIVSLFSLWLGYWISGALIRQFEQLAAGLAGDDQRLLTTPHQDREVALLATALDDYRVRNAALIAREREFTANVSHELRTPLTSIRTSAELLAGGITDGNRAQRIVLAVDDLERRLKGLLFLARGNTEADTKAVELHALVERLAEHYRESCSNRGVALENQVSPVVFVQADPTLLSLLLDNLLRNAVSYTAAGRISVRFEDGWLAVCDTGVGIPRDKLAQVFDRHFRISNLPDGMGLGLSIAREITQRCGWPCELHSELGVGTEVRIQLPS